MNRKNSLLVIFIAFLSLTSCQKQVGVDPNTGLPPVSQYSGIAGNAPKSNLPETTMTFEHDEHDFGNIKDGDKVDYTFSFTNSGKNDLQITNAVGSCGCTVPEYPKELVKPGESGKIKVSFNSAGKSGKQEKSVTLTANIANQYQVIRIKANIEPKTK
jgi:Protein of unknown function (DUF1573)